jgi:chloramphenicol 3-O phosphotransferase
MDEQARAGQIVILNGAPRSGKSSIVHAIQETFPGVWLNLGVDVFVRHVTPKRLKPGVGLRPGEREHRAGPLVPALYAAMYESIAAHSRQGFNVAVDVGHHSDFRDALADCARRLEGLPVLFVGVRCPIDAIMARRNAGQKGREGQYAVGTAEDPVPEPVRRWQEEVHVPGVYDLEVDTGALDPQACAEVIRRRILEGPPGTAFTRLAAAAAR